MTPTEIETAARNQYNAIGDTNWSSSELQGSMYAACLELVRDCGFVIERVYTATTVAGTQDYDYPSYVLAIKRVTYDGLKLMPYTLRDDDIITLSNQASTDQGSPKYYTTWNSTISLRPLPDSAETLKIYAISEPQPITTTSTLEVPTFMHMNIVDYVVAAMAAKDLNFETAGYHRNLWEGHKVAITKKLRLMKVSDAFKTVQAEESHPITSLGPQ